MLSEKRFRILRTYWFLGAVALLLLNDFVLKAALHNWFTGKLSDFAGLFFFPLFFTVFFPKRAKLIFIATALLFIFWKSPFSAGLIAWINLLPGFHYGRVVDFTDLLALSILPVSYYIFTKQDEFKQLRLTPIAPLVISAFAMLATSQDEEYVILDADYYLQKSVEDVRITILNIDPLLAGVETEVSYLGNVLNDTLYFNLLIRDERLCQAIYLNPYVAGIDSNSCKIFFNQTQQRCTEKCGIVKRCDTTNTPEEIIEIIERNFIDFL